MSLDWKVKDVHIEYSILERLKIKEEISHLLLEYCKADNVVTKYAYMVMYKESLEKAEKDSGYKFKFLWSLYNKHINLEKV